MFATIQKIIKNLNVTTFEVLAFLAIISFAVRLAVILIYPDYFFKNTSLMVNTRVFTSTNGKYSNFLGGEVEVLAFKKDGTVENLKLIKPMFNHSYNKVITNLILSQFENLVDIRDPKISSKYLAAKQIFCADASNERIEIIRKLVSQNKKRKVKEYTNIINCKN